MIIAEEAPAALSLAGLDVTFLPGDPPRSSRFAAFRLDDDHGDESSEDRLAGLGEQATIELVLPAGRSVRRRRVPATLLPIATALPLLLDLENSPATTATARIWASVLTAGLNLIARGHLHPAVSPSGMDAWRRRAPRARRPRPPGSSSRTRCRHSLTPSRLRRREAAVASALAGLSCRRCVDCACRHAPEDGGSRQRRAAPALFAATGADAGD